MMFSIIRGFVDIDCNSLFSVIDCKSVQMRGHILRLYKEHCYCCLKGNHYVLYVFIFMRINDDGDDGDLCAFSKHIMVRYPILNLVCN